MSPRGVRLLAPREYQNVLSDVLGDAALASSIAATLPPVARVNGFDNNGDALVVGDVQLEALFRGAEQAAAALPLQTWGACAGGADLPNCSSAFIQRLATKAYGRPLSPPERERLTKVFTSAMAGGSVEEAQRATATAVFASPFFLYRTELGAATADGTAATSRLTAYELASAISFFLTGSRPDDELLRAAGAGELERTEGIEVQARRLLRDAQPDGPARRQVQTLLGSWLDLHDLPDVSKSGPYEKLFVPAVRAAMQKELHDFVDHVLWQGSGKLSELLSASRSLVPAALTPIYGKDALQAPKGTLVELDPARRRGILSLPGFLTIHSAAEHSSPVNRGILVRERFFCQALPEPPPDVVAQPREDGATKQTTRAKFAQHAEDPACRGCHRLMDAVGFGLENMDPLGRFRAEENGLPVDSTGELSGTDVDGPFEGVAALAERLASSSAVHTCFATQVFRFAHGRTETEADSCAIEAIATAAPRDATVQDLLVATVTSPGFALRTFASPSPKETP